jgi:O-antigen/teichoic acid export membrane protein
MTAMLWSGADVFMRQGVQFIVAVILARLLSPEEFGTIALLYLFTGIASVFIEGGFSSALVQKQDASHIDESTVFWINLAMGFFAALILWAIAPWIAKFFGYPILVPLTGILALSLAINSLGGIHLVLFRKRLDFKRPMIVSAVAAIVSGTTAIVLALKGYGVWALAWQTVIASFVSTLLLWVASSWRPSFAFSLKSARSLFRYGSYLMISALLDIAYNRIYSLLIGKLYGVRDLAFYNRADNTKQIPVEVLSGTLARVAFSVFCKVADDKEKLRFGVRSSLKGMMLINLPIMFGLMAAAENVIYVLFGENWLPAVPILQILSFAGVFWPLHVINLTALQAQGHSNLFLRLEIIKKVIGVAFLAIGASFGVIGIAWSQAAFGLVGFFINAHYTKVYLDYGVKDQSLDTLPLLVLSMLMAVIVHMLGLMTELSHYFLLPLQVVGGALVFLVMAYVFRLQALTDLLQIIRNKNAVR